MVDTVTTKLDTVTASLDLISAQAAAVANNPTPTDADEGTLRASLQNLGTRYDDIHANYEDLRVKIEGALDGLATVQKFFPSMEIVGRYPQPGVHDGRPGCRHPGLDHHGHPCLHPERPGTPGNGQVDRCRQAFRLPSPLFRTQLGGSEAASTTSRRTSGRSTTRPINYITLGAVGGTFVLIWLFLAHVGLFHYARRARRA